MKDLPVVNGLGKIELKDDLIKADVDDEVYYFDYYGEIIWEPDKYFKAGKYSIQQKKFRPNRFMSIYYPIIKGISNTETENKINHQLKEKSLLKLEKGISYTDFTYISKFELEFFQKNLMVLMLISNEYPFGAIHGMPYRKAVNIDLKTGKFYKLADLFQENSNYIERINEIIRKNIKDKQEEMQYYDFETISQEQNFIIKNSYFTVYFHPYEISSYAMGFPEFKIDYSLLNDIINFQGSLWQSFNE